MDVDPAEKVEDPAGHVVHALDAATLEYLPMEQLVHTLAVVAPVTFEYAPAGQSTHAALTVSLLYFPAVHVVHVDAPTTAYAPAGQMIHTLGVIAPVMFEYVSAGQLVQLALPELFLNFPPAQAVQTSPSVPVYPMLHLHVEIDLDVFENGDCELTGHDWHLDSTDVIYNSGIGQYAGFH
jgi:hypothetical protein